MNKYDEMSDFEINKAVVCALGLKILSIWTVEPNVFITLGSSEASKKVDYCNNPADMWPIIVENKINLEYYDYPNQDWLASLAFSLQEFSDKKPLRAAAIVFLMMKDSTK